MVQRCPTSTQTPYLVMTLSCVASCHAHGWAATLASQQYRRGSPVRRSGLLGERDRTFRIGHGFARAPSTTQIPASGDLEGSADEDTEGAEVLRYLTDELGLAVNVDKNDVDKDNQANAVLMQCPEVLKLSVVRRCRLT